MDTYSAVPSFQRLPIRIIDKTKLEDWMNSPIENNEPIPTIVKIFVGYEKGDGCPVPVAVEVDRIETEYTLNQPSAEEINTLSAMEFNDKWRRVNMLLRRNLLLAVIRDFEPDDANHLATDEEGPGYQILVRLGWLESNEAIAERRRQRELESESETENKEEGEAETGS